MPLKTFLEDDAVSEIMVNGPARIYIEKSGRLEKTSAHFKDEDELMAAIRRIAQMVGRNVGPSHPTLDARLPDGSRVHAILPPGARSGPYLTIRKFRKETLNLNQMVAGGSLSKTMAKFLNLCVLMKKNVLISGGTSSGKTSLLGVIASLVSESERLIVMEDSSELQIRAKHVIAMETQLPSPENPLGLSMTDLLKASLRMRPDRLIVGELRGAEAMDFLQATNTGHEGSMATIHANSPLGALSRLETLAMMAAMDIPWKAIKGQIALGVDIVVQTTRVKEGQRSISRISELKGLNEADESYHLNDIFELNPAGTQGTRYIATGYVPSFFQAALDAGYKLDRTMFE